MQARTVSFFIDRDRLPEVEAAFDAEVLPRFVEMDHFVGLIVLDAPEMRGEVLGLSVWDGDLDGSEQVMAEFRRHVVDLEGTAPATRRYEVLRLVARPLDGSGPPVTVVS